MAVSSSNQFTVRWLDATAKQPESRSVRLVSVATPPLRSGTGCRVALSLRFDPRRTPWRVAFDGGMVSVPKRRGFVFRPAVGAAA